MSLLGRRPRPRARTSARWLVVLALVAVVGAAPWVVGRVAARASAGSADVPAAELLARIQHSADVGWSGYAQSQGGLALPVTTTFSDLVDLAGGTTQMRAWWRGDTSWRVDVLSAVGEKDTVRDSAGMWSWDYQAASATRTPVPPDVRIRLPYAADLLPPELGQRLLSEARASEASRLPGRQIAGHDAIGLRVRPSQPQSTIDRIDVWADAATGLPLRVEVYGAGATLPAMSTQFLDVSVQLPALSLVGFTPPVGATLHVAHDFDDGDIANAIDSFSHARPPATLAGLPRSDRTPGLGAVGVYGRGVTELVAVPLFERIAGGLRTQLASAGTAVTTPAGDTRLGAGPLQLLITEPGPNGRSWLLAGTVTPATLIAAAAELATLPEVGR